MFRPSKIFHTTVIVNEDKVQDTINEIYERGICELKETKIDLPSKYSYELVKNLDDAHNRFNFIVDSLDDYKEVLQPEKRLKDIFSPEPPIKHESRLYSTESLIEEIKSNLELIEPKILQKLEELERLNEKIDNNEYLISNLSQIPEMKTNILSSSEHIKVFSGIVANTSIQEIRKNLSDKSVIGLSERSAAQSFLTVFCDGENSSAIEKTLHSVGFESLEIPYENKTPREIINSLRSDNEKLIRGKEKISAFLRKTQKVYSKRFSKLSEELNIAKEKVNALHNFRTTESFSVLEAWVPEKDFEKFHETIKNSSNEYYMEADEKEDSPTLLDNPKPAKPFELITEMYSLPKYKQFDPTIILAVTFTIFFGFMLTDFAYGLILAGIGYLAYKGATYKGDGAKNFSKLLIYFGISAALIGIVFGSYFGDFFQKLGFAVPTPIDPMQDITLMLGLSLGIGFIHIFSGLFIGFIENLRSGKIRDGLRDQAIWILVLASIVLFILKQNLWGIALIILAVIMQVTIKMIEEGAITAILSIFAFPGFIGDLFSYARLMALAVGTAGIALAVNFIVLMVFGFPFVGWVFGIIIFIIGHLFNLAMNGLGAFIHTTRLHFLEFFTKFYDGGGKGYVPFLAQRDSTYIKQEGGK